MNQVIEVFIYFFRLGLTGFGGPLALAAQMQKELVEDKKWLSDQEFRRAFALIKAMPGPVATQLAIYISRKRAGTFGGIAGGVALILPCFIFMIVLARSYDSFVEWPAMVMFLQGIQMAALALIFYSLRALTHPYWRLSKFWILLLIGFALMALQSIPEFLLIFVLGCWALVMDYHPKNKLPQVFLPVFLFIDRIPGIADLAARSEILDQLFWICFRAGAFIFGTGLAIIPALQADFVEHHQWVTADAFKDALAFGQLTPGPVVMTVTFLGYKLSGVIGATVATIAVFLPSFFHHLTWFPRMMSQIEKFNWLNTFLMGAIAAVAAGIIYVVVQMTKGISSYQGLIFVASLALLMKVKIQPALLILLAGGAALLPQLF